MGIFQTMMRRLVPGYMAGPYASVFHESIGLTLDELAERSYQGMRESIPYAGGAVDSGGVALECSPGTLLWHAKDKGVRLYDSESLLGRRVRVSRWHQFKREQGTPQGPLHNVQPFFLGTGLALPWIRIVTQSANAGAGYPAVWSTVNPSGVYSRHVESPGNWNYDNRHALFSRWWAIMYLPAGYGAPFHYDDGPTYDSGARYDGLTELQIADFVGAFKEGGETPGNRFAGLILTWLTPTDDIGGAAPFDPASTSITLAGGSTSLPSGNWGSPVWVGGASNGLASRPPWAEFVYEDNQ